MTLNEAISIYRSKDSIEKVSHSLKNEIEIKPLRVWAESSIKGAVMIVFLSQLFVSLTRYIVPEVKKGIYKILSEITEEFDTYDY